MFIHKSHSKLELCNIIERLDLNITNPKQYKKSQLCALFLHRLKRLEKIKPDIDLPFNNVMDIKYFLSNPNPKKLLSIKEKNNIVHICKKIKHFCRNNFNINLTEYEDIDELHNDALYVSDYGSIPSVRKAIREYNECSFLNNIEVNIPQHVIKELEIKNKLKQKNSFVFQHKKGQFLVKFD